MDSAQASHVQIAYGGRRTEDASPGPPSLLFPPCFPAFLPPFFPSLIVKPQITFLKHTEIITINPETQYLLNPWHSTSLEEARHHWVTKKSILILRVLKFIAESLA